MNEFALKLLRLCVPLLALVCAAPGVAYADMLSGPALTGALRTGGLVLVMRHAHSPQEKPDASIAEMDNSGRERQLDDAGKVSAVAMGSAIKKLGVPVGEVLTSPAFRAVQTARMAGLTKSTVNGLLSDGGMSMQTPVDDRRMTWLRDQAAMPPAKGSIRILVTHLPNIAGAFGEAAQGIGDGEALVFRPDGKGAAPLVARIKIEDWPNLAGGK